MGRHGLLDDVPIVTETAFLMDDADIEAWWAPHADVTARLIVAVAAACLAVPAFNSRFCEDSQCFEPLGTLDLGIAIDAGDHVRVPVLSDIGRTTIGDIQRRLESLRLMVTDRIVRPSVTLAPSGRTNCRYASFPLAPPQVAVVAAGHVLLQPVGLSGKVVYRHVLPLTLTYDARACGPLAAIKFIEAMKADLALHELPLTRGWRTV